MFVSRRSVALVACFIVLRAVGTADASDSVSLKKAMGSLAQNILDTTKKQPVTVGQFTPTALRDSNSGISVEQELTEALEAGLKGSVRPDALFEVKGDYRLVPAKPEEAARQGLKEIRIRALIIDKENADAKERVMPEARFNSLKDMLRLTQGTASLSPDGTREERNREFQGWLKEPSVFIDPRDKTLISSSEKSLYSVEILVKPLKDHDKQEANPLEAKDTRGEAFVDIPEGNLYEVKVYNRSPREVAISLTIDGIDVFHFSKDRDDKGKPSFTHFIIAPKATETIVGWHNTIDPKAKDNFLSFLVTAHGQGAVSRPGIKSRGKVGVIHVQFSECKPLKGVRAAAGNETGFGPPRQVGQKPVRYEIKPPHDFVSVRYTR